MSGPLRVLCLDIEGGHGGSSRSLFHLVRHVDPSVAACEVWCKRQGPLAGRYAELGIPCLTTPAMPKVSSLPKNSRNVYVYARAGVEFLRAASFREQLEREVGARFDVVHFNHEALYLLARWLRPRVDAAFTMHVRTNLWDTVFARFQARTESASCARHVFITENERENRLGLGGAGVGSVVFNVVSIPEKLPEPLAGLTDRGRFRVASLSNCSWGRGTDRLVEVARVLRERGRDDVVFIMAGDMALSRSLPGDLGATARAGGNLEAHVKAQGLDPWFRFLGHVSEPERVLSACHVLAKPTREYNPWGRDILEAMSMGRPVLSVGRYDTFVESDATGVLLPEFEPGAMADAIIGLADSPGKCETMGRAARDRVADLCDGPSRAADLAAVWREAHVESGN